MHREYVEMRRAVRQKDIRTSEVPESPRVTWAASCLKLFRSVNNR